MEWVGFPLQRSFQPVGGKSPKKTLPGHGSSYLEPGLVQSSILYPPPKPTFVIPLIRCFTVYIDVQGKHTWFIRVLPGQPLTCLVTIVTGGPVFRAPLHNGMACCFGKQGGNHIHDPKATVNSVLTGVSVSSDSAIRFCPCPIAIVLSSSPASTAFQNNSLLAPWSHVPLSPRCCSNCSPLTTTSDHCTTPRAL